MMGMQLPRQRQPQGNGAAQSGPCADGGKNKCWVGRPSSCARATARARRHIEASPRAPRPPTERPRENGARPTKAAPTCYAPGGRVGMPGCGAAGREGGAQGWPCAATGVGKSSPPPPPQAAAMPLRAPTAARAAPQSPSPASQIGRCIFAAFTAPSGPFLQKKAPPNHKNGIAKPYKWHYTTL